MEGNRDELLAHVARLIRLLKEFAWIYDYKVTEFFARRVWENIPDEWHNCLLRMSTEDLRLLSAGVIQGSWPISLQAFVREATTLGLRCRGGRAASFCAPPPQLLNDTDAAHGVSPVEAATESHSSSAHRWRGVTPKKAHEVVRMASLIDKVCRRSCSSSQKCLTTPRDGCHRRRLVIDVGSGLGYLGEHLAAAYDCYDVIGLECVGSRAHAAQHKHGRHGSMTAGAYNKMATKGTLGLQQVNVCGSGTVRTVEFDLGTADASLAIGQLIDTAALQADATGRLLAEGSADGCSSSSQGRGPTSSTDGCVASNRDGDGIDGIGNDGGVGNPLLADDNGLVGSEALPTVCMVGLHCCGDLTPTAMRLFCQLPSVRSAVLVGCCYHKMALGAAQGGSDGSPVSFPLSNAVRSALTSCGGDWRPSVYALRLAANETAAMLHRLTGDDRASRRRHVAFRAVLETALRRVDLTAAKKYRKLVASKMSFDSFSAFADEALRRLRLPDESDCELKMKLRQQLDAVYKEYEPVMPYVDVMSALQATVQDALESLIVLDRVLSLRECDSVREAVVAQVFDASLSPRNLAIVAWKRDDVR